jgi:hypothetical protein
VPASFNSLPLLLCLSSVIARPLLLLLIDAVNFAGGSQHAIAGAPLPG